MSNQSINIDGLELSIDDAERFLTSFGKPKPCPVCSTNDWNISFSPGNGQYLQVPTRDESFGIPFYIAECLTCGYTHFHTMRALMEWKIRKRGAST